MLPRPPQFAEYQWKWRATWLTEEKWRRLELHPADHPDDPDGLTRPLTAEEDARMRKEIEEERANYTMRSFVGTAGLAQYMICLVVIALSVVYIAERPRLKWRCVIGLVPIVVSVIALGLAFYRGYFTSLGI
jgi:hypothetical protein